MLSLYNIYENIILEGVSTSDINDAIDNKYRVNINYAGDDNTASGKRQIEVYAFGISKAGNDVIRAFQLFGDTKTVKPQWKLFRIDRITNWEKTKKKIYKPVSDYDSSIPPFNPNGDNMMQSVRKIMKF